jgi:hypothetical protein
VNEVNFRGEFRVGEDKELLVTVTAVLDADAECSGQVHVDAPADMRMSVVSDTLMLIAGNIGDGNRTSTDYYTPN